MIKEEAVAKENVVIRAGRCALTLIPHLGGKIASLQIGGQELLQSPLTAYAPRTRTMSFDTGDASGWDECLPSVAACTVETAAGTARIPDHGDLWRVEWSQTAGQKAVNGSNDSVTLHGTCFSLPLELERTVQLTETANGCRLRLDYALKNTGSSPTPWAWAAHPLFIAEAGDRIVLPESLKQVRLEGSGGNRLGRRGDAVNWPIAALADGNQTDLSLAQPAGSAIGDKLFAGPLRASENWCALERPRAGVRIKVSFDPIAMPYLGLWICYGGWPEGPGAKQACVALEPTTAPVDSLAEAGPWSRVLAGSDSFSWSMDVDIESI
jgi:galactose mutarotase-like enzyme